MDDESYAELSERIDGLRLIVSLLIVHLPNRYEVAAGIQQAETHARMRNLPTGVLREMADLRKALDDLGSPHYIMKPT